MIPELVLVDFDDTLVDTGPRFSERRARLFDFMVELGFDRGQAVHTHHEVVEQELIPLMGFGPFRLAPSFRDTYLRLCIEAGRLPDRASALAAEMLAGGIEDPPPAFPGAIAALRRLTDRFATILYTQSGFPEYQLGCIRAAGVLAVLSRERVRITPEKSTEAFRAVLGDMGLSDPARALMIGNSVKADVNPALEAGARAIWVNGGEVWHHDRAEPLDHLVPAVPRFHDAVERLLDSR